MLGKTYAYERKNYQPGDILITALGSQYRVIKNLGWASFRTDIGGKKLYTLEVEFIA